MPAVGDIDPWWEGSKLWRDAYQARFLHSYHVQIFPMSFLVVSIGTRWAVRLIPLCGSGLSDNHIRPQLEYWVQPLHDSNVLVWPYCCN